MPIGRSTQRTPGCPALLQQVLANGVTSLSSVPGPPPSLPAGEPSYGEGRLVGGGVEVRGGCCFSSLQGSSRWWLPTSFLAFLSRGGIRCVDHESNRNFLPPPGLQVPFCAAA